MVQPMRMTSSKTPRDAAPAEAYFIVDGRRWRATDPHVPEPYRQELVSELMSARRAVRDAGTADEARPHRARVNDAKVALGERGHPWWLEPQPAATLRRVEAAMRALLRHRHPDRTVVASDVARVAGGRRWRALLPTVRAGAAAMAQRGEIAVVNRGHGTTGAGGRVVRYRLAGAAVVLSSRPESS